MEVFPVDGEQALHVQTLISVFIKLAVDVMENMVVVIGKRSHKDRYIQAKYDCRVGAVDVR